MLLDNFFHNGQTKSRSCRFVGNVRLKSIVQHFFAETFAVVADGQENPWVNVEGMKFYEVQKYFTEVNYQFHPDPFYVNAAWWNGLPEEYRDIITECATKMGEYNDELIDKNSSAAKQTIVDSGCEVYEPSADELKAFQTAVQSVYDQCVTEGICTADEIKEMQDIVAKA